MIDIDALREQLMKHEGLKLKPYRCTEGKLTIGYGRNLEDAGITKTEAAILLDNDIRQCMADCSRVFGLAWEELSDKRKMALIDMRYNLGKSGFLEFKNMISAVNRKDFKTAASEMVDSEWFKQVGHRGITLKRMMETE